MPPPSSASRSGGGVGGRGPFGFFFGRSLRFGGGLGGGASSSSEELSPSKGAGGLRFAFGAGASSDDDSGGAGRAFFAGGGFEGGRASSDESLSRMDRAFFFFAEVGAAAGAGAGAGAAAPAALRRRASAAARRFSSRRRLNSAPLRPFTFGFSARSDSAVTIVLPLVRAAPKLCLGLGFAIGFGGGRASSSEEVLSTMLCAVVSPSRNLNLPAFLSRSDGLRSASDKITATRRSLSRLAATCEVPRAGLDFDTRSGDILAFRHATPLGLERAAPLQFLHCLRVQRSILTLHNFCASLNCA